MTIYKIYRVKQYSWYEISRDGSRVTMPLTELVSTPNRKVIDTEWAAIHRRNPTANLIYNEETI